eukprot:CAMPEP_0118873244 /NCGR_PEP_ID=MMETSP1163-20130328/15119_1 /TAXON_ID=124430 /ORGANISM="Phaeomonas parva, Strain CCMP2877" /LENGTH=620 /DNA_ID=CAMNT_0006808501 /DNA_START=31 /DNA_END=1893 /DNA_ORIENTATION=-
MANVAVAAAPPPMVVVLPSSSGASRPTAVPADLKSIPRDDAPAYDDLINFPRARDKELAQCVMCGRRPGGQVVIPRQNKDVCKDCDRQIWQHTKSAVFFKWCKGCKRFLNLARFGERISAAKCEKCRHRARQSYMAKKTKAGLKAADDAQGKLAEAPAAATPGFIPAKPKPGQPKVGARNPFDGQTFTLVSNASTPVMVQGQVISGLRVVGRAPAGQVIMPKSLSPSQAAAAVAAAQGQQPYYQQQQQGAQSQQSQQQQHAQKQAQGQQQHVQFTTQGTPAGAATSRPMGGVGSVLKMDADGSGGMLPGAPTMAVQPGPLDGFRGAAGQAPAGTKPEPGQDMGGGGNSFADPTWGRSILSRTPRSFTAGSYEISNMKRNRVGSISRRLRSASDLEETGIINRRQKGVLKDMLISGDEQLQSALDKFERGETSALEAIITSGTLDYPASMDILDGFEMDFDHLFSGEPDAHGGDAWPQPALDGGGGLRNNRSANSGGAPALDDFTDGQLFAMDDVDIMGDRRSNAGAGGAGAGGAQRNFNLNSLPEDPLAAISGPGPRKNSLGSIGGKSLTGSLGLSNSYLMSYASDLGAGGVSASFGASLTGDDLSTLMQPEEAAANMGF